MRWSNAIDTPTDRKLREFAFTGAIILAGCAVWRALAPSGIVLPAGLAALALAVSLVGVARPRWLASLYRLAMITAFPLAWLISHLLLAVIYYCLFTPLGLVFRLAGRDALDRAWPASRTSYWREKPRAEDPQRYLRQF
jgi:hypothetical protein